ncbi:MAG: ribosome silencing factor [Phycisphaerae bacterium]
MPGKGRKKGDSARELAIQAARTAEEYNATDILVLDLRETSPVTDYFVICTGTSGRQMRTLSDELARRMKARGERAWRRAGEESAQWIILDFVNVVVHIFDEYHRRFYDLELIWGEAPRVDWSPEQSAEPRNSDR